ncbi:bacterial transcriptional activator domain-containing protein [Seohaeicola zhoushanensis]
MLCSGRADAFDRLEALIGSARRVSQALEELSGTTALPLHRLDQMVALDIRATESDLEAFLAELRHDRIPLRLATDPNWPEHILAGLDEVSPMFRGWVRIMRSMWRRRLLGQLERVIGRTDPSDEAHEAAADAILLLEPGNEIASYARISARHALGDQSAALDEFRRLDSYLKETHAVSPGARILDLIRSIRARVAPQRRLRATVPGGAGCCVSRLPNSTNPRTRPNRRTVASPPSAPTCSKTSHPSATGR